MPRLAPLLLALVVALASVTMAQARHQPRIAGAAVLCTNAGIVAVAVDAQGRPTGPVLPCPDCLPPQLALPGAAPALPAPALRLVAREPAELRPRLAPAVPPGHRQARAPPAAV